MKTRIYVVSDKQGKAEQLVRATHRGQALRHAFVARVATQGDLERMLIKGMRVSEATAADLEEEGEPELV